MLRAARGWDMRCVAIVALVLSGCGASERPVSRPVPAPRVVSEVSAEPIAPECRIESVRAEALAVTPEGQEPFAVSVTDGALVLIAAGDGRTLDAEVEHPLRFRARAPVDEQRLVSRTEGELAAGALQLVPPTPVLGLAHTDRGIAAQLQLGRRSPSGEGVELAVGPVRVPCESIVALADAEPETTTALPRHVTGGELRVASTLPLVLRPLRVAPAELEVRPAHRDDFVPVWLIDREGESARVVVAFGDGSRIEGWASATALREPSSDESARVERMVREEGSTPVSYAALGAIEPLSPGPQADEYVGSASLRGGSAVLASPAGSEWARSAAQPLEVRVRWQHGQRYAELLEVPGMWIAPGHAWVERGDVAIPEP